LGCLLGNDLVIDVKSDPKQAPDTDPVNAKIFTKNDVKGYIDYEM
jgi:hypothetical protein